jgi:outer membrane immunogenic protein
LPPICPGEPRSRLLRPPVFTWTGFYAGLNAGAAFDSEFKTNQLAIDDRAIHLDGGSGIIGGGQVGYNHQLTPALVLGIEADIQGADIQKSKSFSRSDFFPGTAPTPPIEDPECQNGEIELKVVCPRDQQSRPGKPGTADLTVTTSQRIKAELNWFGTARVRGGFLVTDRFMLFATGGFAFGDVSVRSTTTTTTTPGLIPSTTESGGSPSTSVTSFRADKTMTGYSVGGGAEYAISYAWTIKAEYLFVDLGDKTYFPSIGPNAAPTKVDVNFHVARLGVNFRF